MKVAAVVLFVCLLAPGCVTQPGTPAGLTPTPAGMDDDRVHVAELPPHAGAAALWVNVTRTQWHASGRQQQAHWLYEVHGLPHGAALGVSVHLVEAGRLRPVWTSVHEGGAGGIDFYADSTESRQFLVLIGFDGDASHPLVRYGFVEHAGDALGPGGAAAEPVAVGDGTSLGFYLDVRRPQGGDVTWLHGAHGVHVADGRVATRAVSSGGVLRVAIDHERGAPGIHEAFAAHGSAAGAGAGRWTFTREVDGEEREAGALYGGASAAASGADVDAGALSGWVRTSTSVRADAAASLEVLTGADALVSTAFLSALLPVDLSGLGYALPPLFATAGNAHGAGVFTRDGAVVMAADGLRLLPAGAAPAVRLVG